jgi:hypothetical protein
MWPTRVHARVRGFFGAGTCQSGSVRFLATLGRWTGGARPEPARLEPLCPFRAAFSRRGGLSGAGRTARRQHCSADPLRQSRWRRQDACSSSRFWLLPYVPACRRKPCRRARRVGCSSSGATPAWRFVRARAENGAARACAAGGEPARSSGRRLNRRALPNPSLRPFFARAAPARLRVRRCQFETSP